MLFLHFLVQFREISELIEGFKSAESGIYVYAIISGSSKLILWQEQNIFIHLQRIGVENVLGDEMCRSCFVFISIETNQNEIKTVNWIVASDAEPLTFTSFWELSQPFPFAQPEIEACVDSLDLFRCITLYETLYKKRRARE